MPIKYFHTDKFNLWFIKKNQFGKLVNESNQRRKLPEIINRNGFPTNSGANMLYNFNDGEINEFIQLTDQFISDCNMKKTTEYKPVIYMSMPNHPSNNNLHIKYVSSKSALVDPDNLVMRMEYMRYKVLFYDKIRAALQINKQYYKNWSASWFESISPQMFILTSSHLSADKPISSLQHDIKHAIEI